ncbi:hypothetical protein [uncultured Adlercreutzia sp.]|uniref:hypothetical protein n=1 Tax=uncultured Adlercreutzia sp. TaxID=875803 RepID=UPI00266C9269|nr:hypothetical protein [uncultured Adlercreutzia sp.]
MSDEEREKLRAFLTELRDLCGKYGYKIGGCGCCDSPWIVVGGDKPIDVGNLRADGQEASVWVRGEGEVTTNER